MRNYKKYKKIKTRKKKLHPYLLLLVFLLIIIAMSVGYGAFAEIISISGKATARYKNYTINYELNNGTNPANPVNTFTIPDNYPLPVPTRNNFDFGGWYLTSDFSGSAVILTSDIDVITINPSNDTVVLYAKWTASTVNYTITYNNITNSNNYPSTISSGSTYTQIFTTVPNSVIVTMGGLTLLSGTDFTYANGTLIIPNVSGNLVITGRNTQGSGTIQDPYVDTGTTYDPGNAEEGITVYPNVPGEPKITVNQSGEVTSFEYTDVGSNGLAVGSGDSVDTGILAFDGSGFTIHLKATMNPRDNAGKYMLSALKHLEGTTKYAGFIFYCYSSNVFSANASQSGSITSAYFGSRLNANGWRVKNGTKQTFTLDITYTPAPSKALTIRFTPVQSGSSSYTATSGQLSYIPDSLDGVTITIGGSGLPNDTSKDINSMTILEFSITKT